MAKFGLYLKNNEECIIIIENNSLHSAILHFKILKNLPLEEFVELFDVKEIK